ncbi:MAG: Gfo/Idh/MocA family oxidoreductase [Bacteroidota bacterium]|nr:Gfo/Idh/MocA family oxidoreductase [Bacteroidota bacterium]
MNSKYNNGRRKFIKESLSVFGGIVIIPRHVLGRGFVSPSDKISLGFIGTGVQGRYLMKEFNKINEVNIIGASDIESAKLDLFESDFKKNIANFNKNKSYLGFKKKSSYHDIIKMKEIDAVVVATPDHWHAKNCIDALNNGLDVFCEKPTSHTLKEGRMIVDAVKKNKSIFQTGSMQRSWFVFRHAVELVRNGYLGTIKKVIVNVGDPAIPCDLPAETPPSTLNWDHWLGSAPFRPYNSILSPPVEQTHFPRWRFYEEYGGGILADWGAHMFDIAQWGLNQDDSGPVRYIPPIKPNSKVGLKMFYKNGVEMEHNKFSPDGGFGVKFIGSDGNLIVTREKIITNPKSISKITISDSQKRVYKSDNHYTDWIKSIKSRKDPICNAEVGHRTSSICQIGNIAYKLNQPLDWDPKKEFFLNNSKANKLRGKKYRKPFKI